LLLIYLGARDKGVDGVGSSVSDEAEGGSGVEDGSVAGLGDLEGRELFNNEETNE